MSESMKYIIFLLHNQLFAVEVEHVVSIERFQPLTEVPRSTSFIKGITKIRDVTTPIIDLKERLLMPHKEVTEETKILVVQLKGIQLGFIIDEAIEVKDINRSLIEPAPNLVGEVSENYVKGVAKLETGLLILLEIEMLINFEETAELKKIITE